MDNQPNLIELNLLPLEHRVSKTDLTWIADRRVIYPSMVLVTIVVVAFLLWAYIQDTKSQLEQSLDTLKVEVQKGKPIKEQIDQLQARLDEIAKKNKALKSIQVSKKKWLIIFENVSSVLPPNMWINSLTQTGQNMDLQGVTYDFSEIAEYMIKLEKQISFNKVSLVSITTISTDGEQSYSFSLMCALNQDLGLEFAK
jgi:type IV pilus assembly protein PilN